MSEERTKGILLFLGVIFIIVFCIIPFMWMIIVSLSGSPDFLVTEQFTLTLRNYVDVLTLENLHFVDYLKNSIVIAGIAAIVSAAIGAFAAYALSRFTFPGKIPVILAVLALSMFPQISVVGYLYRMMTNLGWVNTYQALVFPYIALGLPFALWMLLSYFSQIPIEIDKAAKVDGASTLQIIRRIIVPIALPGYLSTVLLLFMLSFNEFLFALMLTTDFRARTVPVGIALFQGLHGEIPWGYIMSASAISCIPVIVIALVFQKYIVQGLTRGAVK